MKQETLREWLVHLDTMVAKLDEAARLNGLNAEERQGHDSLKKAVASFERAIEERDAGVRIPPGLGVSSALKKV